MLRIVGAVGALRMSAKVGEDTAGKSTAGVTMGTSTLGCGCDALCMLVCLTCYIHQLYIVRDFKMLKTSYNVTHEFMESHLQCQSVSNLTSNDTRMA